MAAALRALALAMLLLGPAAPGHAREDPLAALEQQSRARPAVAAARLGALLQTLPVGDSRRVPALALHGVLLAERGAGEGSVPVLRELDGLAARDRLAAASAGLVRGTLAKRQGPLRQADRHLGDALATLPADAPGALHQRLLVTQARVQEDLGRYEASVRLLQQAITLADHDGPAWRRGANRTSLAYTLMLADQPDLAAAQIEQALQLARSQDDAVGQAQALAVQSFLLGRAGDAAGELRSMQAAIEMARAAGSREEEVRGLANLADHYLKRGDHAMALKLSQQALPLARELGEPSSESVALSNAGLALISMQRRAEGMKLYAQAMAIEQRAGAMSNMAAMEDELGRYLERAGYLADALAAYGRHRKLADEVFQRDQQGAILELNERFDSDRRERELELLERDNRLKQAQLLKQSLTQQLWLAAAVAGALLLALCALLLLRLRRQSAALSAGNAQLLSQSERDPLTGLGNRRHLQRAMAGGGAAPQAFEGSLLLIDIDHFKRINDRHGHAAGDAVLAQVAHRLRELVRDEDLLVRWGGEEFLLVAPALTPVQVEQLAQRLLQAIAGAPLPAGDAALAVTASIGYASFPIEPSGLQVGWERALELVDTALFLAKAHGRNRAYGVRLLHARDSSELAAISRGLEAAWTDGRVALTPLRGPAPASSDAPMPELAA